MPKNYDKSGLPAGPRLFSAGNQAIPGQWHVIAPVTTGLSLTRSRRRPGLLPALAALSVLAATSEPAFPAPGEEPLTAPLADALRAPAQRCEWIANEFEAVERQLSLYREELASIFIAVDGRTIGDTAGGAILAVEFDTRRTGPTSLAIAIDGARIPVLPPLAAGRRLEAWFTGRDGRPHPLFCGVLAILRQDAATRRIDAIALMPRAGTEGRSDERYLNVTCADVLERLADAAGLAIEIRDQSHREVFPLLERRQLATWPFIREIARRCDYEIVLQPGGRLFVTESAFAPPAVPSRQWTQIGLGQIAERIARDMGRRADVRLTAVYPPITILQTRPDEDFLAAITIAHRVSAWLEPSRVTGAEDKVMVVVDGVWASPAPVAAEIQPQLSTAPDELLSRITVVGSADGTRSFRRTPASAVARQADPERIPAMQTTLLLGRAMRVAEPPRFALADHAATAAALEGALVRLGKSTVITPEHRFLIGYARSHRPTLLHLYRRMPGGLQALDAMGR